MYLGFIPLVLKGRAGSAGGTECLQPTISTQPRGPRSPSQLVCLSVLTVLQLTPDMASNNGGSGLGLFLVKLALDGHNADVNVVRGKGVMLLVVRQTSGYCWWPPVNAQMIEHTS